MSWSIPHHTCVCGCTSVPSFRCSARCCCYNQCTAFLRDGGSNHMTHTAEHQLSSSHVCAISWSPLKCCETMGAYWEPNWNIAKSSEPSGSPSGERSPANPFGRSTKPFRKVRRNPRNVSEGSTLLPKAAMKAMSTRFSHEQIHNNKWISIYIINLNI